MAALSTPQLRVPFLDLRPAHEEVEAPLLEALAGLAGSGAFVNGPAVAEFEEAFAAAVGTRFCTGVGSGLDALRLTLLALGLEPGEEVVVPAMTFVATLEAVTQAGGVPVVADVGTGDYGLDPAAAAAAVGPRTRALLPVHLYGQLADMRALAALAERHGLALVEDACQAHGAERDGLRAGACGRAAAFSFYPTKNLGAWGDAGAVATDDGALAERVRALRQHGQDAEGRHAAVGYTARLDTLQALVLLHKLPRLAGWNDERRAAARFYTDALADVGDLRLPPVADGSEPVWHLFVVRTADPAALAAGLAERGIGTHRHYPVPVHLTDAYAHLGHGPGDFPVAEALAAECVSLPLFTGMTPTQLEAVAEAIRDYFARG